MLENNRFEQDYYSRTTTRLFKKALGSIRLRKWLTYYERSYYEKIKYNDLLGSIPISLKNDN